MIEREVTRREPHLLVAALVFPTGFVTRVRFEQPALQVLDRGAGDRLVEVRLQPLDLHGADHRAEALDRADPRQRRDRRLPHAFAQQVLRLRDVREDLGPELDRRVEDLGAELIAVRLLPRPDRGHTVTRARRDVPAVRVETAVAAHAARNERLGDVVIGEQLRLGPGQLEIDHRRSVEARPVRSPTRNRATTARPQTAGATAGTSGRRGSRPRPAAPP